MIIFIMIMIMIIISLWLMLLQFSQFSNVALLTIIKKYKFKSIACWKNIEDSKLNDSIWDKFFLNR